MKKKIIVLVPGLILLTAFALYGCGGNQEYVQMNTDDTELKAFIPIEKADSETVPATPEDSPQLTALVDTLEEAHEIADLYGIELDSYSYGVAAYRTDKDIEELLRFGQEQDYPTLEPNQINEIQPDTMQ